MPIFLSILAGLVFLAVLAVLLWELRSGGVDS